MKTTKRILALLCAIVMVFSLALDAWAADDTEARKKALDAANKQRDSLNSQISEKKKTGTRRKKGKRTWKNCRKRGRATSRIRRSSTKRMN